MTLPPRPWALIKSRQPSANTGFHVYIADASGRKIAAIWGKGEEKELTANHIINLVNEHARSD
jgi:hypothetical protein